MAVYGRPSTKRKKIRQSFEELLFSSDEEENSVDTSESSSRLSQLVHETTIERPKENELLPAASIIERSRAMPRKSPKKSRQNLDELLTEEHLTKSPTRHVKVINSIMDSANTGNESPFVSPIKMSQPRKRIAELILPLSSPKKAVVTPKRENELKKTPSTTPNTTPNEKHAWDDLFEHIGNDSQKPERSTLITERDDSEEDTEEILHLVIKNSDLDNIYRSLNQDTDLVPEPQITTPRKNRTDHHQKTYGGDRSYLLENPEEESMRENQAMNKEMISNYYDYQEENKDTVNINDLRNLGKKNSDKEELEYLLEGLVFKTGDVLERCNQILISSLIDLNNFDREFLTRNCFAITRRLNRLFSKAQKETPNNGQRLIMYLLQQSIMWFFKEISKDIVNEMTDECIEILFIKPVMELDNLNVLNITRNNLSQYISQTQDTDAMQVLLTQDRIYTSNIFAIVKSYPQPNLEYFENFYQKFPSHSINELDSYISKCFTNIENYNIGDSEMSVLKILVVVSTNGNQNMKSHVGPLLNLIIHNYENIVDNKLDDNMVNASLFSMGYLINIVESDRDLIYEYLDLLRTTEQKINLINPTTEIIAHLIGYNSIILSFYRKELDLNMPSIINNLKRFEASISNTQIELKISSLLSEIINE